MTDMILIITMIFMAICGYFLMKSIDNYYSVRHQREIIREKENRYRIRLAVESEEILRAVEPVMEYYMDQSSHIQFNALEGRVSSMIWNLKRGKLDVVILTEESFRTLRWNGAYVRFSKKRNDDSNEGEWLYVLWDPTRASKKRDRFVFGLKHGYQRLTCGYRNY
ncbi:MAG: hypothetical protein II983_07760 [Firmicutes bacterium]|nr:hypothetical protein [Bacillota bacterium]MBQ4505557.1 hypothetical protein [Bacillota bacterium]